MAKQNEVAGYNGNIRRVEQSQFKRLVYSRSGIAIGSRGYLDSDVRVLSSLPESLRLHWLETALDYRIGQMKTSDERCGITLKTKINSPEEFDQMIVRTTKRLFYRFIALDYGVHSLEISPEQFEATKAKVARAFSWKAPRKFGKYSPEVLEAVCDREVLNELSKRGSPLEQAIADLSQRRHESDREQKQQEELQQAEASNIDTSWLDD